MTEFDPMAVGGKMAAAGDDTLAPAAPAVKPGKTVASSNVSRDHLRAFVERVERLEEEKKTVADDIKDVYGEAKSMGFNTKILKRVIALRKKDDHERMEEDAILDTYLQALGMISGDGDD